MGVRRDLAEADPQLCVKVCDAFDAAKTFALGRASESQALFTCHPWGPSDLASAFGLLGPDPWPNGIEPNRKALEALCRYSRAQGIVPTTPPVETLFAASTRDWRPAGVAE